MILFFVTELACIITYKKMGNDFLGCEVSVEVRGGLGYYQGRVVSINTTGQTITLKRVIHNGRPTAHTEVTIK